MSKTEAVQRRDGAVTVIYERSKGISAVDVVVAQRETVGCDKIGVRPLPVQGHIVDLLAVHEDTVRGIDVCRVVVHICS